MCAAIVTILNRPSPAKKFLTTSATKANARKYLTQMLFINTPALQIRASLTLEKHHGKYSDNDKNSEIFEHLFNCKTCQNSDIVQNFTVLKRCK